ncbi:polysaccharide biosynthesis protein [Acidisarcina polymorpha]|uniref:Polysaccharide biosynthesis protein n=1 Tax=Acidisarcina polymorpha TaxID=2211140 RepID=A0A2Z5G331_9BACT|nr:oligosaccharide flippase family protein [Acidisarcina polymorpha]AXC12936.1 polysaccharide biosynthesis protein [Acidisarcina polymorpha]
MSRITDFVKRLREHQLSRNASWILIGQGANFLLQAIYFVFLARLLGVTEYGIFAGAFALVSLVTPYSSLGAGMLFMRYVSADHTKAGVYWGNALLLTSTVSVLMTVAFFFVGPPIAHINSRLIFVVLAIANCLFSQISELGSRVFQTFEKMRYSAMLSFVANLSRVVLLLLMRLTMKRATAVQWSIGVMLATGVGAVLAIYWVHKEVGKSVVDTDLLLHRSWEGVGFSFAGTTQAAYNDIDKTMLSHYGLNRENGFYSLAYRVVDFATTPIVAIDGSVLPRFFKLSHGQMPKLMRLAFRAAALAALIGLGITFSLLLVSPIIPRLVGHGFAGALVAIRWLAWLPLLRGIHRMTGGALTGSGRQNMRTVAQFVIAGSNFLLNLWWIPKFGWIGAAWASVAADGGLAVLNTLMLLWVWSRMSREGAGTIMEEAKV